MSRWISSAELHLDSAMGQTISVAANSYIGAVAKREATIFTRRVGELFGIRNRRYDIHKGPRLIFVNFGTRRTTRMRTR